MTIQKLAVYALYYYVYMTVYILEWIGVPQWLGLRRPEEAIVCIQGTTSTELFAQTSKEVVEATSTSSIDHVEDDLTMMADHTLNGLSQDVRQEEACPASPNDIQNVEEHTVRIALSSLVRLTMTQVPSIEGALRLQEELSMALARSRELEHKLHQAFGLYLKEKRAHAHTSLLLSDTQGKLDDLCRYIEGLSSQTTQAPLPVEITSADATEECLEPQEKFDRCEADAACSSPQEEPKSQSQTSDERDVTAEEPSHQEEAETTTSDYSTDDQEVLASTTDADTDTDIDTCNAEAATVLKNEPEEDIQGKEEETVGEEQPHEADTEAIEGPTEGPQEVVPPSSSNSDSCEAATSTPNLVESKEEPSQEGEAEKIIVHRKCIRVKRSELNELIDLFQCLTLHEKENPISSEDEEPVTSADVEANAEVEAKSEAQNFSEEEDPHGSPDETIAFHHPADDLYHSKDFDIHQMRTKRIRYRFLSNGRYQLALRDKMRTKRIRCRYLSNGRYQLALRDKVVAYIEKVLGLWTIRIPKGELTFGVLCEGEELKRDVLISHAVYTVTHHDQEVDRIEIGRVEWTEAIGCTFRKILGQGGCGLIVEGRSIFSNYAIKLERSECTERSSSEADIALKMSSGPETQPYVIHTERVIPVRDVTQPGDDIIISVMERAHHDLYGYIRAVPSTLDNYKVMEKLATGVQAIHTAGVLHLNLKPANILMVGKDPKIADWGLSKWIEETWTLHGSGTPGYAAPEVLLGAEPNTSSDIFSLGRIFYEMITGRQMAHVPVPSKKEEFFEYEKSYNKTLNDELQWIDCSTLRRLLFTMMTRDVEERTTTEGVLFELALLTRPKSPVQKRKFKARRSSRQL
ncbi:hypothetical protein PROFUN_15889 [Planoprotostelium fungivorum]|uniref:Protein kinase domain-containing protein n=1 Tax=Planoprotostelium fungivorum TaxID=1890364 RepID=A0A2P6MU79_9EUKA|nr:hypothetical protein PROFUN_15889 [Planoprotostelium fungivorum]